MLRLPSYGCLFTLIILLYRRKHNKDPAEYRPDIIHQELMAVLDSPLNKAGKVKVYMHTGKNVLIEINPKTRIPRTFKRFAGLMGNSYYVLSSNILPVVECVISSPVAAPAEDSLGRWE